MQQLNPTTMMPLKSRLAITLRTKPMGYILVVVQLMTTPTVNPPPPPVIMLVAAPSMATLGVLEEDKYPGIFLANIWQPHVLQVFGKDFNPELAHCPTESLSCEIPIPTIQAYIANANPIFIPESELTCSMVSIGTNQTTYRTFLLPEICSPPLGLAWPVTTGIDAFLDSLTALGKACMEATTPTLTAWLTVSQAKCNFVTDVFLNR
jgi:hypothetical protein